jgi:4-amino-4-deoxy-L-arabinose transferase-like glycosyltransferase
VTEPLPFWARPVPLAVFLVGVVAVKLALAGTTELVADEAYYALWSLYPSLGYHDHPPMIAWLMWIGQFFAGENELGVRLAAVLGILPVAAALYRMGEILFGDARTGALAVIWYVFTPAGVIGFQIATPDVPSVICWTLAVWAAAEFTRSRNANWWLAIGLFAGLGLVSKYTNLLLGAGLLLWILSSAGRRAWLKLPQLWLGGLIALLVWSPNLWWNAQNGWATFRLQFGRSANILDGGSGNWAAFLPSQLFIVLPPLALLALIAIVFAHRKTPHRDGASLLALTSLPLLLYFALHSFFGTVQANWTMPVWPSLALLAAALALSPPVQAAARNSVRALAWLQLPLGVMIAIGIYAQVLSPQVEIAGVGRTAELHGWRDLARKIAAEADAAGATWFATSNDYADHAHLAFYLRAIGDPRPVREIAQLYRYRYRLPVDDEPFASDPALLVVGVNPDNVPPRPDVRFNRLELRTTVSRDWGRPRAWFALYAAEGLLSGG